MEFIHFKSLLSLKKGNQTSLSFVRIKGHFQSQGEGLRECELADYIRQCVDSKLSVRMVSADGSLRRIENQRVDHPQNVIKQYMRNYNDLPSTGARNQDKSIIKALPARPRGQWTEMRTVYISAGCNHVLGRSGNKLFIENSTETCLANVTTFSRLVSHLCLC